MYNYVLGIDASNIRAGGGITHLVELLRNTEPHKFGFTKVIVWGGDRTLARLPEYLWLVKKSDSLLNGNLIARTWWQRFRLSRCARGERCDALFIPGGSFSCNYPVIVTLSQNMLPFERKEAARFGWSWMRLKFLLLRFSQSRSFKSADGVIFLTAYARDKIIEEIGPLKGESIIIPHGIDRSFFKFPRSQKSRGYYSETNPYRIIYLSIVDMYKHQWKVAEAVAALRRAGFPVVLELIGPAYPPAMNNLLKTMDRVDPRKQFIFYRGALPYSELPSHIAEADIFLFASTCENMPNILLEGMASGLPVASSNKGPMPGMLGDAGIYFDPEDTATITCAIERLINDPGLRYEKATASFEKAQSFSWERCSDETFSFFSQLIKKHQEKTA